MKLNDYDESIQQRDAAFNYAHSSEMLRASVEEIEDFMRLLEKYEPKTAPKNGSLYLRWKESYAASSQVLKSRLHSAIPKQANKIYMLAVGVATLALIVAFLAYMYPKNTQSVESSVSSSTQKSSAKN